MKDDFKPVRPEFAFVPVANNPKEQNSTQGSKTIDINTSYMASKTPASTPTGSEVPNGNDNSSKKPSGPKAWWAAFLKLSRKKQALIAGGVLLLLVSLAGSLWWFVLKPEPPKPAPPVVQKEEEPPKPTTVPSRLTGIQVKPELNDLPTTGVMIENSPDARPQAGLQEAGVVFEAIAEGGITRFLALYLESKPSSIGPVRSVRPYYLDFLAPFDAPLAHAGGSPEGLSQLRNQGFKDLEAFQNPGSYQRVSHRYAPHNLYTSRDKLLALQKAKKWTKSTFTGFMRKEDKPAETITAKSLDFSISSHLYNPHFDYDKKSNSYLRTLAGRPHSDEKTGKRIAPKVVIALVMSHRYAGIYSVYGVTGSGTAYIFQDGTVTKGTWEKRNRKDQFRFGDAKGSPLAINAGQTWLSAVSSNGAVKYKP